LASTTNGMDALDDFYADHPFVDWCNYSQHFWKCIGFWTWWLPILRMPLHTSVMLCKRLWVYERLDQEWPGIHLLLSKITNSILKSPVANRLCRLLTP